MDTLTYMVASALPGALATTSPTIAARMAFEAACVACELIDRYQQQGGNPLSVLSVASAAPPVTDTPQGWQPIETAPEMRKVMVSYVNVLGKRRCVLACYYLANSLEMHDDYAEVGTYDDATGNSYAPEGWYEEHESEHPIMRLEAEPTHWMPMPAAPTVPPQEG